MAVKNRSGLLKLAFMMQIVFLYFSIKIVYGRKYDTYDLYDLANLRRDYLSIYCPLEPVNELEWNKLENFLNCSKTGLSFPNVPENISAGDFTSRFHDKIQSWCLSWSEQKECEKHNEQFVDSCFSAVPSTSVGFDIISALFEAACSRIQHNNSTSLIAYLVIFRRNLRHWWYNERDVVSCFNEISLEYYKRDINMVLNCIKYQLRYRNCPDDDVLCKNLFKRIQDAVTSSYSSSGYVYLTSLNLTLINSERFPVIADLGVASSNGFSYIAFFSLLVLVVIALGLLLALKVKCINSYWVRYQAGTLGHEELVQDEREGNNAIEM